MKDATDTATPYVRKGLDVAGEVARPVIRAAEPIVKVCRSAIDICPSPLTMLRPTSRGSSQLCRRRSCSALSVCHCPCAILMSYSEHFGRQQEEHAA